MVNITKLLEYNHYLLRNYLNTFSQLSWKEFIKDRGASFNSLRNIYLHCIAVVDYHYSLVHGGSQFPQIDYDEYDSIEKIRKYLEDTWSKFTAYLDTLTPKELSRTIERKRRTRIVTSTIEDNLIHMFQEEIHHVGEFIALLWQMDIAPPHDGWLDYLPESKI